MALPIWKRGKSQGEEKWSRRASSRTCISFPGQASLAWLKAGKRRLCPQEGLSEQKAGWFLLLGSTLIHTGFTTIFHSLYLYDKESTENLAAVQEPVTAECTPRCAEPPPKGGFSSPWGSWCHSLMWPEDSLGRAKSEQFCLQQWVTPTQKSPLIDHSLDVIWRLH